MMSFEGKTMRERLQEELISEQVALKWTMQMAVALHYLQQKHIVYRNLRPENIIIDQNDNAFIADTFS